jgi:hypothetical protein
MHLETFIPVIVNAVVSHADEVTVIDLGTFVQISQYKREGGKPKLLSRETVRCDEFGQVLYDARNNRSGAYAVGWAVKPMKHSIYAHRIVAAGRAKAEHRATAA